MPDDYRPYGAPQSITTHIRAGKNVKIEEVMPVGTPLVARHVDGEWIVEGEYAPAEGRVFKLYKGR